MPTRLKVLPSRKDLATALATARRMLDRQLDPQHLALGFAYLHDRNEQLEEVLIRLDHYLRYGMSEHDLAELTRDVEKLRERGVERQSDASLHI